MNIPGIYKYFRNIYIRNVTGGDMGMMNSGCGSAYMPRLAPHLLGVINIWWDFFVILDENLII